MSYSLSQLHKEGIHLPPAGMKDKEMWQQERARLMKIWQSYLGVIPPRVPVEAQILSITQETDHARVHLTYAAGDGERVPAYLLLPERLRGWSGFTADCSEWSSDHPAVLALHPTHPAGKADIAAPGARENRAYGLELVSRGFVVLAPDTITAGERIGDGREAFQTAAFYESYPEATAVGKMLHDHQQALDVITALPFVDAERIGVIGHSLGAYNAFFLGGVDARIKAIVASCGLSPFRNDPEHNRWGQRAWFSHIPRLTADIEQGEVPFEWQEIAALCAPTPFFNWICQRDRIFPHWQEVAEASLQLDSVYRLLDAESSYVGLMGNEDHDFPEEVRILAYRFLEKWIKP